MRQRRQLLMRMTRPGSGALTRFGRWSYIRGMTIGGRDGVEITVDGVETEAVVGLFFPRRFADGNGPGFELVAAEI